MNQQMNPAIVTVVIIVVLAVVGFFAYKTLGGHRGNAIEQPGMRERYESMTKNVGPTGQPTTGDRPSSAPTGSPGQ